MSKKHIILIVVILVVFISGGVIACKLLMPEETLKEIPDTYEELAFGSTFEEVRTDADCRGEKVMVDYDQDNLSILSSVKSSYEDVEGQIVVVYSFDEVKGVNRVCINFTKDKCKPGWKKIYDSYKKRLNKYCEKTKEDDVWNNKQGTKYKLSEDDDCITYVIYRD